MELLSFYIHKRNPERTKPIDIFVAGDAAYVRLGIRYTTITIDFLTDDLDTLEEVITAREAAAKELEHYPFDWINMDMLGFLNSVPNCKKLMNMSVKIGDMLYSSDVLRVYILDWRYQLTNMIQLIGKLY